LLDKWRLHMTDHVEFEGARLRGVSAAQLNANQYVTGNVTYAADLVPENALHVAVLRSPHARANIVKIDLAGARASEGVVFAIDGIEAAQHADPAPPLMLGLEKSAGPLQSRCLAVGQVVYVGQPVAAVVADTREAAEQAVALIDIQFDIEEAVTDAEDAIRVDAAIVHPGWTSNVFLSDRIRSGDPDAMFEIADCVIAGELTFMSSTTAPMETICYIAQWDARSERLTLTGTFQHPHSSRMQISKALRLKESQVRVAAPNTGGTFGLKMAGRPEEILVGLLSCLTKKVVVYLESRRDCFRAPGRSQNHKFALAAQRDGKVLAFRDRMVANVGVIGAGPGWAMSMVTPAVFPTVYAIRDCDIECKLVVTNTPPWQSIRGYGKEVSNVVMERALDLLALELHLDPVQVRRINLIPATAFPYLTPSGYNLDSGDYEGALDQLLTFFDYEGWRARASEATDGETATGIGIVFELTPEGGARPGNFPNGSENAMVRVHPSGEIVVATGTTSPGSGSDTGIAQLVGGVLQVPLQDISVVMGDTDATPVGTGNGSSRAAMYGGMAAYRAAQDVRKKIEQCAANVLQCDVDDIEFGNGFIYSRLNPDATTSIAEIALGVNVNPLVVARGVDLPLEATRSFSPGNVRLVPDAQGRIATYPTFSYSVHAAVVEVELGTGVVKVLDYAVVHDCGSVINPAMVEGQLKGAIVMGIGAALWEELVYDENHQLVSDRFKSYLLPRATDLPSIRVGHRETPNPFHPLGMKGAGESGVGGGMAVMISAVSHALGERQVNLRAIPATAPRVLRAHGGLTR
jgi:aerobic carbon-monoxide dehydrogenase large subunit